MNRPILIFDSGVGGLPYLVDIRNKFPWEDYIYIADSKNFPYGEKSKNELISIIKDTIGFLVDFFNPKVVVIACNTASVTALGILRETLSVPVVGVVPAVKIASEVTINRRIGVLATKRTVEGNYLKSLIEDFTHGIEVFSLGASDIVTFVENRLNSSTPDEVISFIEKQIAPLKEKCIDSVVLGCTHFIHVADEIGRAFGSGVRVIDSREGVTNQVQRVTSLRDDRNRNGNGHFYYTKKSDTDFLYHIFCEKSNLELKGELTV